LPGRLRRRVREPVAVGAWRWPRGFLATCLATHSVYAVTVAVVDDRLG